MTNRSFIKRFWWISLFFVVPFFIGGAFGWLWVEGMSDRPKGSLTTDGEIVQAEREIDARALRELLIDGAVSGATGLALGLSAVYMRLTLRKKS